MHTHTTNAAFKDLTPAEATARLGELRIIDVREDWEFVGDLGHIAGAELFPLSTVVAAAQGWDRAAELLVVCRSGARSGRAAHALAQMGFQKVHNLSGGMMRWDAEGRPRV